jgi:hypothetical protein
MPSLQYSEMKRNVDMLRSHLLPADFDPLGEYEEQVFTGVVAFRVLCHAAIEDYFEERVVEIAQRAQSLSANGDRVSKPAACLVAFSGIEMRSPPPSLDPEQPNKKKTWLDAIDIKRKISNCATSFIRRIKTENHGIREKNLLSMLLPIGIDHSTIDKLALSELDNFGRSRGEFAHSTLHKHVTKKPNPEDEWKKVQVLLEMISVMDLQLDVIANELVDA